MLHKLFGMFYWTPKLCFVLALTVTNRCNAQITDEDQTQPETPFSLTYTPVHVVNQFTRDVSLVCANDVDNPSQLEHVSRIRLLKQSSDGWELVARQIDNEATPHAEMDVSVSANISGDIKDTFLKITWALATKETFGTYKCEIIGLKKDSHDSVIELTSEIILYEEEMSIREIVDSIGQIEAKMSRLGDKLDRHETVMSDINKDLIYLKNELNIQRSDIASLTRQVDATTRDGNKVIKDVVSFEKDIESFKEEVESINETIIGLNKEIPRQIIQLNKNMIATSHRIDDISDEIEYVKKSVETCSRDICGIKADFEKASGNLISLANVVNDLHGEIYFLNNTLETLYKTPNSEEEKKSNSVSSMDQFRELIGWPVGLYSLLKPKSGCPLDLAFSGRSDFYLRKFIGDDGSHSPDDTPWSVSQQDSKDYELLEFCEASGSINSQSWPDGFYCVNQMHFVLCPEGLYPGNVFLSSTASSSYVDYRGGMKISGSGLGFCCKSSGSLSTPMVLPTHSPFLLYRYGGQCQQVAGMDVTSETLTMDIVSATDTNVTQGTHPDMDIHAASAMKIYLCYYTKTK